LFAVKSAMRNINSFYSRTRDLPAPMETFA
jgi:hypothetical protein